MNQLTGVIEEKDEVIYNLELKIEKQEEKNEEMFKDMSEKKDEFEKLL